MPLDNKTNIIKFTLDTSVYSQEAIISVGYRFIDETFIYLDQVNKDTISVSLKRKNGASPKQLSLLKDRFYNDLLNISERINAARRNKKIREFIVGRALFSAVDFVDSATMSIDDDPLGITSPFNEEKPPLNTK